MEKIIYLILGTVALISMLLGLQSGRRKVELQAQEIRRRQEEMKLVLQQIHAEQTETNKLLRELIEKTGKT